MLFVAEINKGAHPVSQAKKEGIPDEGARSMRAPNSSNPPPALRIPYLVAARPTVFGLPLRGLFGGASRGADCGLNQHWQGRARTT